MKSFSLKTAHQVSLVSNHRWLSYDQPSLAVPQYLFCNVKHVGFYSCRREHVVPIRPSFSISNIRSPACSDIFSKHAGGYETLPWEDLAVKFFPPE